MIASLFFTFGIIFGAFSIISLFPLLIALSFGEADQVEVFFLQFALLGFLSGSLIFAFTGKVKQEDRMTEFRILVLAWLITPIFLSLPLYWQLNVTWFNALFETVSGLTTTGATIFNSLDTLPKSIIFWRAFLQWAGGFATLVGIVLVLAPKGAGGLPLLRLGGQLTQIGMKKTLRLFSAYAAITSACLVALALTGIPFFDAVSLALTSVSTGGFMPRDGTISDYNNALAEIVLIAAMVAGATSIVWHRMIIQKRVQQLEEHKESYALIALVLIMGFIIGYLYFKAAGSVSVLHPADAMREGIFTAASIVTTTGFDVRYAGMQVLPLALVLMIVFVGGGTMSTAGGIKLYRVGIMAVQSMRELDRTIYPHAVRSSYVGSVLYDIQLMKSIWTLLIATSALIGVAAGIISMFGLDPVQSLTLAMTAISNAGTVYQSTWLSSDWQSYVQFPAEIKSVLMILMVAGRVEIILLISILLPLKSYN